MNQYTPLAALSLAAFAWMPSLHAQVTVYDQQFDSAPTTVIGNAGSAIFKAGDVTETYSLGEFVIASNTNVYDFSAGKLLYDGTANTSGGARSRTIGVLLDVSAYTDNFNLSFLVTDYAIHNPTTDGSTPTEDGVYYSLWSVTGVDATNTFEADAQVNSVISTPDVSAIGTAAVSQIGATETIAGTGTIDVLDFAASEYLFIAFTTVSDDTEFVSTASPTLGIDNILVSTIPEPSAYGLLTGCLALGAVMTRRRL